MIAPIVSWAVTALVITLLVAFGLYILGLIRLPSAHRPRTRVYNRYGEVIGKRENPDHHVSLGEESPGNSDP